MLPLPFCNEPGCKGDGGGRGGGRRSDILICFVGAVPTTRGTKSFD